MARTLSSIGETASALFWIATTLDGDRSEFSPGVQVAFVTAKELPTWE
jgi:hypothetical protein